jgi:hypothetical protein
MRKIYTTFQGRAVDMDQLLQKNETMPAVGNVRVNARGDELGPDGNIIRTRESVLSEYYDSNPTSVIDDDVSLNKVKIQARKSAATETVAPTSVSVEAPNKLKSKEVK